MGMMGLGLSLVLASSVGSIAQAQTGGNLPLANIGKTTGWIQDAEQYRIVVSESNAGQPLNLEVYSPGMNLNDYANGRATVSYYGDELYGRQDPFITTFTLQNPKGDTVFERSYGSTTAHTLESLWPAGLPAGSYKLRVQSSGYGKNAYALRVAAPFTLESSFFTVNARGDGDMLAAKLRIGEERLGKKFDLLNFDADGDKELEVYAVTPDGQKRKLVASENGKSLVSSFEISKELIGEWSILVRILKTTNQYSNAITFKLTSEGDPVWAGLPPFVPPSTAKLKPPLLVEVVDPEGKPIPGSSYTLLSSGSDCLLSPVLPKGYLPISGTVLSGTGQTLSSTQVKASDCGGKVRFVARPNLGNLVVETVVIVGENRVPLRDIPVTFAGKTFKSPANVPLEPGSYNVTPSELPDATVEAKSGTVPLGGTGRVVLEYRVKPKLTLQVSPNQTDYCGPTNIVSTASTNFPYPISVNLKLNLPKGITSNDPLETQAEISANKPVTLNAQATACESGPVTSSLTPYGLTAKDSVEVKPPRGNLEVDTVAIIGKERVTLRDIPVTVEGKTYKSPVSLSVQPGDYDVTPTPLPDSSVDPETGKVVLGKTTRVTLEYRVVGNLKLLITPDVADYCGPVNLIATANTAFPYAVPMNLKLNLPKGISTVDPLELSGSVFGGKGRSLEVSAKVCEAGQIATTLEPFALSTSGEVKVAPPTTLSLSKISQGQGADFRLTKKLERSSSGYTVNLLITVDRPLESLRLSDPLPIGGTTPTVRGPASILTAPNEDNNCISTQAATRIGTPVKVEGNTLILGRLAVGKYVIVYPLFTDLAPSEVVTDPDVIWEDK